MSSSRWWTVDAVHRSDLKGSHWWLGNLPSRDDVYVFAGTRPTLLCFDGQPDARHLPPLVDSVTEFENAVGCRRSTLSKKPAAWSEILDIQVSCRRGRLAGSTRMRGPAMGGDLGETVPQKFEVWDGVCMC